MTVYECSGPGCDAEYTVAEGEPTDSMFVSYSVSPHDVEGVEKRAFSLCETCALQLDGLLPGGTDTQKGPGDEVVPVDDLRDLIEKWTEVYNDNKEAEADYGRGMAEGARSAANGLKRLLEREAEADA